jgi:hypothetical protein
MSDDSKRVLDKSLAYLIGPIDEAKDQGIGWRRELIRLSEEYKLKIKFLDPTNKLKGLQQEVGTEQDRIARYRTRGRWKDLSDFMKVIVRVDLRQVDFSDFVIAKVDKSIHMCGSYHEIFVADIEKKPILAIIKGGKKNAPAWLFGILDHNLMFDDEEECVKYLVKINDGDVELDDRWVLLRKQLDEI